jgi:tRNA A-37 threonylcarbamoyl transferase component Bud32
MHDPYDRTMKASLAEVTQDHARKGTPLSVSLRVPDLGEVVCSTVLRAIRGKRIACIATAQGSTVIVKLYFARHKARRNWMHSSEGCRAFIERGIPAPRILFSGYLGEYGLYALIMEYLEGGSRVDTVLEGMPKDEARDELLCSLMETLAAHHAAGILQNDLHLGNFMLKDGVIYSLDGDQAASHRPPISRRRSRANLARLLANFPFALEEGLDACIDAYAHARAWSIPDPERKDLMGEVYRIRKRNLAQYLRKVHESRDPFITRSGHGFFSIVDQRRIGPDPGEILDALRQTSLDPGMAGTAGYRRVSMKGGDLLVMSSYGIGPLMLRRLWRAGRVWKSALMLARIGIGTPQPVALVLTRRLPLLWEGSVLFTGISGSPLKEFLTSDTTAREARERVVSSLAEALARMKAMGIAPARLDPGTVMVEGSTVAFLDPGAFRRCRGAGHDRMAAMLRCFISGCTDIAELRGLMEELFRKKGLI